MAEVGFIIVQECTEAKWVPARKLPGHTMVFEFLVQKVWLPPKNLGAPLYTG